VRFTAKAVLGVGLISAVIVGAPAHSVDRVYLQEGQTEVVRAPGVERVAVGDGEILKVEALEKEGQVLMIGLGAGWTDVRTWSKDGAQQRFIVRVRRRGKSTSKPQIDYLLKDIDGVSAEKVNGETIITGSAPTKEAYQRVQAISEAYDGIRAFVEKPGLQQTPTIYIKAQFVEVRKNTLNQLGIDWSDTSPGISFSYASDILTNDYFRNTPDAFPGSGNLPLDIGLDNGFLGVGVSFTSVIDLLGQNGEVTVIAEPTLSALSGSEADFQAGGEVPIPVQNEQGETTVIFKDYGILLNVSPVLGPKDLIRTKVEVEVSDLDDSTAVRDIPGFTTRNASTEMNRPSGETLVIAGLVDSEASNSVDKVPGVGDVPVFGEFFRSERTREEETELVVLVTPYVEEDLPNWQKDRRKRAEEIAKGKTEATDQLPIMD